MVRDRLERVPARPHEGERVGIGRDAIVARVPIVEAPHPARRAPMKAIEHVDRQNARHLTV